MNAKRRLIDMIRDARDAAGQGPRFDRASLGSTLVRLAHVAAAAHRFEAARDAAQPHASGRLSEENVDSHDKDVVAIRSAPRLPLPPGEGRGEGDFLEPSSTRTEVDR